jgi:uncharacterized protein YbjT (DUF2867 family)
MYAIAGVTGNTGKIVANTLLDAGVPVRVIVRDAKKGEPFAARGAQVAVADLADATALARALDGVSGAYLLVPPNVAAPDFAAYQREVTDAIGAAVTASKVPHVVFLSSVGAELASGTGPVAGLYPAEAALRAAEATGTVSTFIRAGYFLENIAGFLGGLAHGILPTFYPADLKIDMITTQDIGRVAAALLLEGAKTTSVVELGGPGLSINDIADALGTITGKRPQVVVNPVSTLGETLVGYGFTASLAGLYQELAEAIIDGRVHFHGVGRQLKRETPVVDVLRGLLAG